MMNLRKLTAVCSALALALASPLAALAQSSGRLPAVNTPAPGVYQALGMLGTTPTDATLALESYDNHPLGYIWRLDYDIGNNAGQQLFKRQLGTCANAGLNNDGGKCRDAVGGNSWIAVDTRIDVRQFGAKCDTNTLEDYNKNTTILNATGVAGTNSITFGGSKKPTFSANDVGKYLVLSTGGGYTLSPNTTLAAGGSGWIAGDTSKRITLDAGGAKLFINLVKTAAVQRYTIIEPGDFGTTQPATLNQASTTGTGTGVQINGSYVQRPFVSIITGGSGNTFTVADNLVTSFTGVGVAVAYGTNDHDAIQAAFNATGGGDEVFFPEKCGSVTQITMPDLATATNHMRDNARLVHVKGRSSTRSAIVALGYISGGLLSEPARYHRNAEYSQITVDARGVADYPVHFRGFGGRVDGTVKFASGRIGEIHLGDGGTTQTQNFSDTGAIFFNDGVVTNFAAHPHNIWTDSTSDAKFASSYPINASEIAVLNEGGGNTFNLTHAYSTDVVLKVGYRLSGGMGIFMGIHVDQPKVSGIELAGGYNDIQGGHVAYAAADQFDANTCGIDIVGSNSFANTNTVNGFEFDSVFPSKQYVCLSSIKGNQVYPGKIALRGLQPFIPSGMTRKLVGKTTDASTIVMTQDGATPSTANISYSSSLTSQLIDGILIGRTGTGIGTWKVTFEVTQGSTAASTTVSAVTITAVGANTGYTNPTVTADTTNGAWNLNVSGIAAKTIFWDFAYHAVSSP